MSSRASRISVQYTQRMFYGLKSVVLSTPGMLSEEKKNNSLVLQDKAGNIDYVIECVFNPKQLKSLAQFVCLILIYDITRKESLDNVIESYKKHQNLINKSYQFTLLIGNKCDLEEYRDVTSEDVESVANEHQMIFFETSSLTGKNIDYIQKLIRVRCAQTMKKFQIQPSPKLPSTVIHEEESESISQPTDSLRQDSSSSSVNTHSSVETPPSFPVRAELSPEYNPPPPLPDRGDSDDLSSANQTPIHQMQGTQNETPHRGNSSSERESSSNRKRASSLIADLAQKPSQQKNFGAKFKEAYRHSIGIVKSPPEQESGKRDNDDSNKRKYESKTRSSISKQNVQKQLFKDDADDEEIRTLEQSISEINQKLEVKQIKPETKAKFQTEPVSFRSENSLSNTHRFFQQQEDKYVPVVDTFLYDAAQGNKTQVNSQRSRSTSPLHQVTSRLNLQDFTNQPSFAQTTDPRLYSRNLKPIMFLAVEHESEFSFVEVYRDDTLSLVTDRVLHQIKVPTRAKYIVKYIQAIIEHQIQNFSKDLQNQLLIIEKRKLNKKEALEMHFKGKIEAMKQQINTEKVKNNWTNPKNAIGRVNFAMPKGLPLTLHVHENDDPYDLAFYFILDNDLKKSKVQQIVTEIAQVQRSYKAALLTLPPEPAQNQKGNKNMTHLQDETGYAFKANFNIGQGRMIPVAILEGEDINKCVHKIVLDNQLKYEQYVKMVRIIQEVVSKRQMN